MGVSKKQSFKSREAGKYKVRQIVRDIDEARGYGIRLHTINLNEMYSYLKDARLQKAAHQKHSPDAVFKYDPMEDQQHDYSDDGLSDLERRTRKTSKRRRSSPKKRVRA